MKTIFERRFITNPSIVNYESSFTLTKEMDLEYCLSKHAHVKMNAIDEEFVHVDEVNFDLDSNECFVILCRKATNSRNKNDLKNDVRPYLENGWTIKEESTY